MRTFALIHLALAALLAPAPAAAQLAAAPDTLRGQFLFVDGDRAYLRALDPVDARDSLWVPGLGPVVEANPPILKLAITQAYFVRHQMGDTLQLLRLAGGLRAQPVDLECDPSVWDPLAVATPSAFAAAPLFHRGLFRLDANGEVEGDLARAWFWKGFDLFVVIDTTARFSDGTPIDAFAVKSSLDRYFWYRRDVPAFSWQYAIAGVEAYRSGRVSQLLGLIPRSRDTLQFNLARPLYDLPGCLASPELAIVRWERDGAAAPVTATAGYYGRRAADTVYGAGPAGGWIRLSAQKGAASARLVMTRAGARATNFHGAPNVIGDCAAPSLLVVEPRTETGRQLLTFVRFAVDCDAVRNAADAGASRCVASLFPDCARDSADRGKGPAPDLMRARDARQLVRGTPRVRIAGAGPDSSVALYLVDAFKAWNLKSVLVDTGQECDLAVQWWSFGHFFAPLYAEAALWHMGRNADDSLVLLLGRARQVADDSLRAAAYRSLLARIADLRPYVALLQGAVWIQEPQGEASAGIAYRRDDFGRPRGPIFLLEAAQ